ncbi:MAG: hypothetical protein ABIC19_02815 [Patescibacteria group bacterium]|nr:hypothetical protein [Patescibacteria group bacterium]
MIDNKLNKYFWDVDLKQIDEKNNYFFIIERVLNFGNEEAVKWVRKTYSSKNLLEVIKKSRNLDKKTRNFWKIILDPV